MGKSVRMADIAEKLNISVVSVSKALAGKPGVSEEMRAKVVALAKQMGYEGPRVSSELAETGNIGVLVSDRFFSDNTFYANMYRSLVLASGNEELTCMLEIVSYEAERSRLLPALIQRRKVDGIIFMGDLDEGYLLEVAASGMPCLLLDFYVNTGSWTCVLSDNSAGGYALTRHLLDSGRNKIGFVGSIRATSSILDRYLGYQRALRDAGIVPREEWLLEDRGEDGKLVPITLPADLPQAFVCNCDNVAYNLIDILQKRGVRVPEDVAVCGYDDYSISALSTPKLTTYRVDAGRMGKLALNWMGRMLRGELSKPLSCIVPGQMIIRESSGAANI